MMANPNDPRWGGCAPWFLRYIANDFTAGDCKALFFLLSQRLNHHFRFSVSGIQHLEYFANRLATASLSRFRYESGKGDFTTALADYFDPGHLETEAWTRMIDEENAQIQRELNSMPLADVTPISGESPLETALRASKLTADTYLKQRLIDSADRDSKKRKHHATVVAEHIAVLEILLRLLPKHHEASAELVSDIRRFFAETNVVLDIKMDEYGLPIIIPLEEPLLQSAIIDALLPRLSARFPKRASELVDAYHEFLNGGDADTVFQNAFKALEELARELTGDSTFIFDRNHLQKGFSSLHGTIHETLIRLAGHRGDKASHGKSAPPPHEVRYLLFAICNAALLLLDYPNNSAES